MDAPTISPEDFLYVLGVSEHTIEFLAKCSIFTVRQLAEARLGEIDYIEIETQVMLHVVQQQALEYLKRCNRQAMEPPKEIKFERCIWGYTYVSTRCASAIKAGKAYKSPYALFNQYINTPSEERESHPWKDIYYSYLREASIKLKLEKDPSDADIFSYLVWKSANSIGKFDLTAGTRIIRFLWNWMPGEYHGSSLRLDSLTGQELGDPVLADRYTYPVAINLTKFAHDHNAQIFKVERKSSDPSLDDSNLVPIPAINQMADQQSRMDLWTHYSPGDNCYQKVPHGCILTPTGEIPIEYLEVFNPKPIIESFV